ncbi:MAG TPA: glycosyltransferase family 2 protein [Pirellulaceae bacterium]|nr:glycosyltransferase family 2 protein [Pirellulaceae bacterium]
MVTSANQVWVVVPAYNEGQRLSRTLNSLTAAFANVVVVNDGSRDDTELHARKWPVWVVSHPINRGQGAALQTGLKFALAQGAEAIVTFDADGQHSVSDVAGMLRTLDEKQVDAVLGSRFLGKTEGMPRSRWIILKLGVLFTRITSQIKVTDTHNGLRVFSRRAAERIRITMDHMEHASEILDEIRRKELSFCEYPVTIRYTAETMEKGQSSLNGLRIVFKLLLAKVMR